MKTLVTLLFLGLMATSASAQLTLTQNDFLAGFTPTSGQTTYSSTDLTGVASILATSGASQTWDFGNRVYTAQTNSSNGAVHTYPAGAPFANDPDFATATHVIIDTSSPGLYTYIFLKINGEGLFQLGASQDSMGKAKKLVSYTPPLQQYKFPLTYQTAWHSTSNFNVPNLPPLASITETIDGVVDGFGTLKLPNNGSHEVLRLRTQTTQTESFPGFSSTTVSYAFNFFGRDGYSGTISADTNQVPTGISYSVPKSNSSVGRAIDEKLAMRLSSNPASNTETKLYFDMQTSGSAQLELIDVAGRVQVLQSGFIPAGKQQINIDPRTLTPGSYLLRLSTSTGSATQKLMITR